MYCKICGKEIDKSSRFCEYCGAQVTVKGCCALQWLKEKLSDAKDFLAKRWKKLAAIVLAAAIVISAVAFAVDYSSPKSLAERVAKAELEGNLKVYDKYAAYDLFRYLFDYGLGWGYYDEDYVYELLSQELPWEVKSRADFYKVYGALYKMGMEDYFGEYKIQSEATKVQTKSRTAFMEENAELINELESAGLFDVDDVSAVRLVTVIFGVISEEENYRDIAQYWLVRTGLEWKVFFSEENTMFEFVEEMSGETDIW